MRHFFDPGTDEHDTEATSYSAPKSLPERNTSQANAFGSRRSSSCSSCVRRFSKVSVSPSGPVVIDMGILHVLSPSLSSIFATFPCTLWTRVVVSIFPRHGSRDVAAVARRTPVAMVRVRDLIAGGVRISSFCLYAFEMAVLYRQAVLH